MKLIRTYTFEAAHRLPLVAPDHKCGQMHGHSYVLEVHVRGDVNQKNGWVVDFAEIDLWVKPLVAQLDHHTINELIDNPTAENVLLWFLRELSNAGRLWTYTKPGLVGLVLHETSRGSVSYEWPWVGFTDYDFKAIKAPNHPPK